MLHFNGRMRYVTRLGEKPVVARQDGLLRADLWKDRACYIVGGGPSLRGFDWSSLRGHLVIGVNRAEAALPCSVVVSRDARYAGWAQRGRLGPDEAAAQQANVVHAWINTGGFSGLKRRPFDAMFAMHEPDDEMTGDWDLTMGSGNNSGFGALNLALLLGADPIYLLGFDMGGAHWHEGYPLESDPNAYDRWCATFAANADWIRARGQLVVNCSPDSRLACFLKAPVPTVTPVERPLVVNYYTRGTSYERQSAEMEAAARLFGLEVHRQGCENLGGWEANTHFKAHFLDVMLKHFDRPLMWLDADGRVCSYPDYLDGFMTADADVALAYVDWGQYKHSRRMDVELLSGTMLLRPTAATFEMLARWKARNHETLGTGIYEQRNLQDVVAEMGDAIKVARLPDRYCQIHDLMRGVDPIIKHLQASRTAKAEVGA